MSDIVFAFIFHCIAMLSSQNYDNQFEQESVMLKKQNERKAVLVLLEKYKMGECQHSNRPVLKLAARIKIEEPE